MLGLDRSQNGTQFQRHQFPQTVSRRLPCSWSEENPCCHLRKEDDKVYYPLIAAPFPLFMGSDTVKVVLPGILSTDICPLCFLIIPETMERPSPVPLPIPFVV